MDYYLCADRKVKHPNNVWEHAFNQDHSFLAVIKQFLMFSQQVFAVLSILLRRDSCEKKAPASTSADNNLTHSPRLQKPMGFVVLPGHALRSENTFVRWKGADKALSKMCISFLLWRHTAVSATDMQTQSLSVFFLTESTTFALFTAGILSTYLMVVFANFVWGSYCLQYSKLCFTYCWIWLYWSVLTAFGCPEQSNYHFLVCVCGGEAEVSGWVWGRLLLPQSFLFRQGGTIKKFKWLLKKMNAQITGWCLIQRQIKLVVWCRKHFTLYPPCPLVSSQWSVGMRFGPPPPFPLRWFLPKDIYLLLSQTERSRVEWVTGNCLHARYKCPLCVYFHRDYINCGNAIQCASKLPPRGRENVSKPPPDLLLGVWNECINRNEH